MSDGVKGFEDLIAWQRAREMTKLIYQTTGMGAFARDFGLRDQIRRASVSVMSNIAEGFERGSRAQFIHFLYIAKGSCAEVRSQLYIAADIGYLSPQDHKELETISWEVAKIIGGLLVSLKKPTAN